MPTTGIIIGFPETYSILHERPERGMLIARVADVILGPPPRDLEVYLMIVGKDGERHDQSFRVPPADVSAHHWFNFTYPEGEGPFLVHTSGNEPSVFLRNYPSVPRDVGNNNFVVDASCMDPDKPNCRFLTVSYPPMDDPGSAAGTPPFTDKVEFVMNSSVLHWEVFVGESNLRGTAKLISPSGREMVYLEGDGERYTKSHLSNGSRPLEVGAWTFSLNGTGTVRMRLDLWWMKPEGWDFYGITRPNDAG